MQITEQQLNVESHYFNLIDNTLGKILNQKNYSILVHADLSMTTGEIEKVEYPSGESPKIINEVITVSGNGLHEKLKQGDDLNHQSFFTTLQASDNVVLKRSTEYQMNVHKTKSSFTYGQVKKIRVLVLLDRKLKLSQNDLKDLKESCNWVLSKTNHHNDEVLEFKLIEVSFDHKETSFK